MSTGFAHQIISQKSLPFDERALFRLLTFANRAATPRLVVSSALLLDTRQLDCAISLYSWSGITAKQFLVQALTKVNSFLSYPCTTAVYQRSHIQSFKECGAEYELDHDEEG